MMSWGEQSEPHGGAAFVVSQAMPLFVRIVYYGIAAVLLAQSLFAAGEFFTQQPSATGVLFVALYPLALVGLLRRVAWGRLLVSVVSVLNAFGVAANLIPDIDDNLYYGGPFLERLFNTMPPTWLAWLFIVLVTMLLLLPALIISWNKSWFRPAWW